MTGQRPGDPSADPFGVYLHVPFCAHRCDYCAFATWTDRGHLAAEYLAAVRDDIARAVAGGMPTATTVFVGGGTPSLVDPADLAATIAAIPVVDGAEITVECNPDDVSAPSLATYRSVGVNRVSLGVQSMVDHVLGALGRRHAVDNVRRAVDAVGQVGLDTFNLDLIYGTVGEGDVDWRRTLDEVLALGAPHISAYALTIEAGTPLSDRRDEHPDDDVLADRYEETDRVLTAAGLVNYEISNWARPGHECRHNILYWRQQDYLGFGCAAHSHIAGRRWWNVRTPERYIELVRRGETVEAAGETLDAATREFERLELMLRMSEGVPVAVLDGDELPGLVERRGDRWVLTTRGRLMANEISTRLRVPDPVEGR